MGWRGWGGWAGGGGVGGLEGVGWVVGANGKLEAGYTYLPIGLFVASMSPRSASHRPRQDWRALRDVSLT